MKIIPCKRQVKHRFQTRSARFKVLKAVQAAGSKGVSLETLTARTKLPATKVRGCVDKLRELRVVQTH